MILSVAWTAPAFLAGRKTVTRRHWKADYARKWKQGSVHQVWDRLPRTRQGRCVGLLRVTAEPAWEPLADMPDSDYEAEGFAYLNDHQELLPGSMPIDVSWEGFERWRNSGEWMWVVRFEPVEVYT